MEYVTRKLSKKEKEKDHDKNGEIQPHVDKIPLKVSHDEAETQIHEILDSKGGWNLSPTSIPQPQHVTTSEDRWKLKLRLSVAILKKIIAEGSESAATELFQALSAVNVKEKMKHAALEGEGMETVEEKEEEEDDTKLLGYLIGRLKDAETREKVLESADIPKVDVSSDMLGVDRDDGNLV